jgi:hypothetical protein
MIPLFFLSILAALIHLNICNFTVVETFSTSYFYFSVYKLPVYNTLNQLHITYEVLFFFIKILEKLKRQLADADAALEARKKPAEDAGPKIIGEGLVIDEWVRVLLEFC